MKKGFTLVELVAVVTVLCLLVALITPSMMKIAKDRKVQLYESKIKWVESNATSWGNANIETLSMDCTCITVGELINKGYLLGEDVERGELFDPRYNSSMNDLNVCVTYDAMLDKTYADLFEEGEDDGACYE